MLELEELVTTNGSYENVSILNCKDIDDLVFKISKDIIIEFYDKKIGNNYIPEITQSHNYVIPQYIISFKIKEEN